MADVFLSYAREDLSRATMLASALESRGLSVWWDRRIPAGLDFADYIEKQAHAAHCIVVLWSKASRASCPSIRRSPCRNSNLTPLDLVLLASSRKPVFVSLTSTANN